MTANYHVKEELPSIAVCVTGNSLYMYSSCLMSIALGQVKCMAVSGELLPL